MRILQPMKFEILKLVTEPAASVAALNLKV